jgi:peptidoglycan/LPS O-acetylase OafA/YrhL
MDISPQEYQENSTSPVIDQRLDYVDGLRALAALYVLSGHMFSKSWLSNPSALPESLELKILAKFLAQGHFAVSLFIVISGFCLMLPVLKNNHFLMGGPVRFIKKRAWRVLPPFYSAFFLSVGILLISLNVSTTGSLSAFNSPISWEVFVTHLFLVHDLFGSTLIQNNGPLWSVGVEWQIYLLFPILLFGWRYLGALKTTIMVVFVTYILIFTVRNTTLFPIQYVALFTFGMLAAEIAYGDSPKKWIDPQKVYWIQISLGLFAVVASVCLSLGWAKALNYISALDLLIGLSALCLLVAASQPKHTLIRRFLSSRLLVFIGSFSYSLYLIHYPLIELLSQYLFYPLRLGEKGLFLAYGFVGLPIILSLSYLFFLFTERPSTLKAKTI